MDHMARTAGKTPKVLVVGLDGTRPDALRVSGLDELIEGRLPGASFYYSYAGGDPADGSLQPTLTAPGWTSILTGSWADRHGVTKNFGVAAIDKARDLPSFPAAVVAAYPGKKAAVLAAWEVIVDGSTYGDEGIYRFFPGKGYYSGDYGSKDPEVVAKASLCISEDYDVVFLVIDFVDHAGHLYGFSPYVERYTASIRRALGMAGQLVDAMRARPGFDSEDWLVLLTTDHGAKGRDHGGQSPEERGTFIVSWDSQDSRNNVR